ncbi:MAG: hypothetical protein EKK48_07790 [Candidatus Melainabacteria bacterium]|nr:MAG: hypothetical protein EKK48_07790 [Candidatus Melainabacteria bacterium]
MPTDSPEPAKRQVQISVDRSSPDLQADCERAAAFDGEVVVAVREFPSSEYKYLYDRHEISIVCARLPMRGYSVDTKTVMDSKCSKLILVVEAQIYRTKTVQAEKLPD